MFKAADKLRGNMESSDYKHVALGLIFLKYISDAFEARYKALLAEDQINGQAAGGPIFALRGKPGDFDIDFVGAKQWRSTAPAKTNNDARFG